MPTKPVDKPTDFNWLSDPGILFLLLIGLIFTLVFSIGWKIPSGDFTKPLLLTFTPTPSSFSNEFIDNSWNFSVTIPNDIEEKKIFLIKEVETIPMGSDQLLLFSDSSLAKIQQIGPDESIRGKVFRQSIEDLPFEVWAVMMSKYAGIGSLKSSEVGHCESLVIRPDIPTSPYDWSSATWVKTTDYYIGFLIQGFGYYPKEIDVVVASFLPVECDQ